MDSSLIDWIDAFTFSISYSWSRFWNHTCVTASMSLSIIAASFRSPLSYESKMIRKGTVAQDDREMRSSFLFWSAVRLYMSLQRGNADSVQLRKTLSFVDPSLDVLWSKQRDCNNDKNREDDSNAHQFTDFDTSTWFDRTDNTMESPRLHSVADPFHKSTTECRDGNKYSQSHLLFITHTNHHLHITLVCTPTYHSYQTHSHFHHYHPHSANSHHSIHSFQIAIHYQHHQPLTCWLPLAYSTTNNSFSILRVS